MWFASVGRWHEPSKRCEWTTNSCNKKHTISKHSYRRCELPFFFPFNQLSYLPNESCIQLAFNAGESRLTIHFNSNLIFCFVHNLGCQTIWHSIRWDIGQDTYGRRWRILYAGARNSKRQGTARQKESEKQQITASSIQMHDTINCSTRSFIQIYLVFFSISSALIFPFCVSHNAGRET